MSGSFVMPTKAEFAHEVAQRAERRAAMRKAMSSTPDQRDEARARVLVAKIAAAGADIQRHSQELLVIQSRIAEQKGEHVERMIPGKPDFP